MKRLSAFLFFIGSMLSVFGYGSSQGNYGTIGPGTGGGTTINNNYFITNGPNGTMMAFGGGGTNLQAGSPAQTVNYPLYTFRQIAGGESSVISSNCAPLPPGTYTYLQVYVSSSASVGNGTNYDFVFFTNSPGSAPVATTIHCLVTTTSQTFVNTNSVTIGSNVLGSIGITNNSAAAVSGLTAWWSMGEQIPSGSTTINTTNNVNITNNTTNALTFNGLSSLVYLPKFQETNHLSSFGLYPNGYVANGVGITNTTLNVPNGFLGAGNVLVTPSIGERVIVNFAGSNCRFYDGLITAVASPYSVTVTPAVTQGVTNISYAILCTTNSESANSANMQIAINTSSNAFNTDFIFDPPSYYINILNSNVVGQCFVFTTNGNWQLPSQNNAMVFLPPLLGNNTNHIQASANVTIEGQYTYRPWGTGLNSKMSFAPNETVVVVDAIGNDQTGTNYIGNSFLDTRSFIANDGVGDGPFTIKIPVNDCQLRLKNLCILQSYDSGLACVNMAGAADGSGLDNVCIIGGDFGNTTSANTSYEWSLKEYPKDTNSIAYIGPCNWQGTYAPINGGFMSGEYTAIEADQVNADKWSEANNSNAIEFSYSPSVLATFDYPQFGGQFNIIHCRAGVIAAPSYIYISKPTQFGGNVMPANTPINLIMDDYWVSSGGVDDALFGSIGTIDFGTNVNNGNGNPLSLTNWDFNTGAFGNSINNGVVIVMHDNAGNTFKFNGSEQFNGIVTTNFIVASSGVAQFFNRINIAFGGNNGIGFTGFQNEIVYNSSGAYQALGATRGNNSALYGRLTPLGNDSQYWVNRVTGEYEGIMNSNGVFQVSSNIVTGGQFIGNGAGITNIADVNGIVMTNINGAITGTNCILYTVPAGVTNSYTIEGYLTVTALSLDVVQPKVVWTDENGTVQTISLGSSISGTGYNNLPYTFIRAKGGTVIFETNALTTGTGSLTYNTEVHMLGVSSTK